MAGEFDCAVEIDFGGAADHNDGRFSRRAVCLATTLYHWSDVIIDIATDVVGRGDPPSVRT